VADITQSAGRYNILHRDAQRLQVVTAEVEGRDLDGFMRELRQRVFAQLEFPEGVHAEFSGAAVEQAAARRELIAHAAIAGVGVLLLIYMAVGRLRYLLLILMNLPFSLLGGVLAVVMAGGVVSVGSVVGFVTLFGITVRNSIMLVSHYEHLVRARRLRVESRYRAARRARASAGHPHDRAGDGAGHAAADHRQRQSRPRDHGADGGHHHRRPGVVDALEPAGDAGLAVSLRPLWRGYARTHVNGRRFRVWSRLGVADRARDSAHSTPRAWPPRVGKIGAHA
jgi:hypothetical protein